jgi:hypothetical protein
VGHDAACTEVVLSLRTQSTKFAHALLTPALSKEREGQAAHFVADAGEIKSLSHPPVSTVTFERVQAAPVPWRARMAQRVLVAFGAIASIR